MTHRQSPVVSSSDISKESIQLQGMQDQGKNLLTDSILHEKYLNIYTVSMAIYFIMLLNSVYLSLN